MFRSYAAPAVWLCLATMAMPALAQGNMAGAVPPGANTTNPSAPFYVDLTGFDFSTKPPTRDPKNPAYVTATELPDGTLPPKTATGNFIVGPTHAAASETVVQPNVPKGRMVTFAMSSADSVIYNPGLARAEKGMNQSVYGAQTAPGDLSNLIVPASQASSWTRKVSVYIPAQNVAAKPAPFLVVGDGDIAFGQGHQLATVLDNLIAAHRIPPIVAILIGSGGQDAQGSERGREYDTVSGAYAQWVESEVLPLVEKNAALKLTHDPSARATIGISSSGIAAFTMAWFRPDLYRRVIAYSPTFVNQQWPHDPALPGGGWEYHSPWPGPVRTNLTTEGFGKLAETTTPPGSPLVPNSPRKPLRVWFEVGDRDLFYPIAPMADGMHDWVLANENMAKALAAKQYTYQFLFARNAGHVDGATVTQTLPAALEWAWVGYPASVK